MKLKQCSYPFMLCLCFILSACSGGVVSAPKQHPFIEQDSWGKGAITGCEFSPDGKRLGVITSLGVYIYDAVNLTQLDYIPSDPAWPAAAFSPDWSLLATGSGSKVTLLRLADKSETGHFETRQGTVSRLLFSPDGRSLASLVQPPGEEVYTQKLELWAVPAGTLTSTWEAGFMPDLAFASDSQSLYSWNHSQMGSMQHWKIPSGTPMAAIEGVSPSELAISADGQRMALTGTDPGSTGIKIQKVSDGTVIHNLPMEALGFAGKLLFSPDGSRLAAFNYDGVVKVWQVGDGTLVQSLSGIYTNNLYMAISPDNQTLALPAVDGLDFYSLTNGQVVRRLTGHLNAIDQAALSPQGDRVAALIPGTDVDNNSLAVWSYPAGKMVYLLSKTGALGLAWSPSGDRLALVGVDGKIRILRSADGNLMQTLAGHYEQVHSLAWSPDGSMLASSAASVKVWQVSDGKEVKDLSGSGGSVSSLRFSADSLLLAGLSGDGKILVWQVNQSQPVDEFPVSAYADANVIDFAANDSFIAVAEQNRLSLWHLHEDRPFLQMPVSEGGVITLRLSPDAKLLACGLANGSIQIWQLPQGKLVQTLNGGGDGISSLDFSKDGKLLLSASRDGTLRFWNRQ